MTHVKMVILDSRALEKINSILALPISIVLKTFFVAEEN